MHALAEHNENIVFFSANQVEISFRNWSWFDLNNFPSLGLIYLSFSLVFYLDQQKSKHFSCLKGETSFDEIAAYDDRYSYHFNINKSVTHSSSLLLWVERKVGLTVSALVPEYRRVGVRATVGAFVLCSRS